MPGIVYIRCKLRRPPWLSRRKFREVTREAHRDMARAWHRHMLPAHFEQPAEGGGPYGYQRRTERHVAYKRKIRRAQYRAPGAGRHALVFSGLTRKKVLGARPQIRAFPTRARITMPAPSYVTMIPRRAAMPAMGREIVAVTQSERRTLQKGFKKSVERGIERARSSGKKTINA